jgi:hypothetical protein
MVYKTAPTPSQVTRRRTGCRPPRRGGSLKPPADSDLEIAHRRTQDGNEFIGPDGVKVTLNVIAISPQELRSFRRFRNATLAQTWPPHIVTRAEWRSILDQFETESTRRNSNGGQS